MLRIAIVDPSDMTRDPLRSLLLGVDFVWLETECVRYEFFYDVIQTSPPDAVIVSLDADPGRALNLISQVHLDHPRMPILTISSREPAILDALQRGAKYFLRHPFQLEELLTSLRRMQAELQGVTTGPGDPRQPQSHGGQIVAVLGARGGVGTTTFSVNLAATLAADPGLNVALCDLDLALGDCDLGLDLSPDNTIADLADNIERLDMSFLRRSLVKHEPTGVSLLSRPLQLQDKSLVHEEHLTRILNLLKVSYSHLVLDLSKAFLPTDVLGLSMADVILLVTQMEISSLRNTVRILMALGTEDGLAEKVQVVVNRAGSETGEGSISAKKAEETIGRPIFWQVPNDSKTVLESRMSGSPLIKSAPRSRVQQSFQGLVNILLGKAAPPQPSAQKQGGFSLWSLVASKKSKS